MNTTALSPDSPDEGQSSAMIPKQTMDIAVSRAAQEVQAAMVIAKKFPRDEARATNAIVASCGRKTLAEAAIYSYPRGGSQVEGPSIRLAEEIARNWGNMDAGLIELDQRDGESIMMAFAWDLQTNTRSSNVFTVPHVREVGRGANKTLKALEDPRDIYEITANMGARRKRACILALIPGDIIEEAVAVCNRTMAQAEQGVSLEDRTNKMLAAFSDFGVTKDMIEAMLKHRLNATSETELARLRKIYVSIKDGAASREQYFDLAPAAERPAAPPKEVKGAAAVKENPPAKVESTQALEAEKPAPRPAPPAKAETAPIEVVTETPPAAQTAVKAPRTSLKDKESLTVTVQLVETSTKMINSLPSVQAKVIGEEFEGTIFHLGGAVAEADKMVPKPEWQKGKSLQITMHGMNTKSNGVVILVDSVKVIE